MTHETLSAAAVMPARAHATLADRARSSIVALIAFLTLVDLFATQAILPSLARAYRVDPGGDGICGQRDNDWHGRVEPRRRSPQSED